MTYIKSRKILYDCNKFSFADKISIKLKIEYSKYIDTNDTILEIINNMLY